MSTRPFTLKFAYTPRLHLAFEEAGDAHAPAVVLVHGFPDDVRTWDGVAQRLVAEGFRTLTPYLRGFGPTRFHLKETMRSGQLAALGQDVCEFVSALGLSDYLLVGHDWGARAAYIAAAAAPAGMRGLVALSVGYATNAADQALSYEQAQAYWYQWFFATERGRQALETDRRALARFFWRQWSPGWAFEEAEFEATARSFDNPDFVAVTAHSYRHRWGLAPGDPEYAPLEATLAAPGPVLVPTTILHGEHDAATLPETSAGKEGFFPRGYARYVLPGVGHFIQRERPDLVVEAILERAQVGG